MKFLERWKSWAQLLKLQAHTLYLPCKDPTVPWYAKAFAACVAGDAFSPIDLIPDPIPVLLTTSYWFRWVCSSRGV
jgi:uncharacterized membrane protein YkvA (DUF1232 family)